MKNFSLLILLGLFIFVGCSEDYSEIIEEPEDSSISNEAFKRLCFVDEFDLENAIYTHVFDKSWMDFEIGWSNQRGFFVNNINSNNADNWQTYLKTVYTAFNSHRGSLEGGSVYVCGRFGNTWRGMKIVK